MNEVDTASFLVEPIQESMNKHALCVFSKFMYIFTEYDRLVILITGWLFHKHD